MLCVHNHTELVAFILDPLYLVVKRAEDINNCSKAPFVRERRRCSMAEKAFEVGVLNTGYKLER